MKITKIRRTITFGNYENISMEAELEEHDTVDNSLEILEMTMQSIIDEKQNCKTSVWRYNEIKAKTEALENDIDRLEVKKNNITKWMEKHNISDAAINDLPF